MTRAGRQTRSNRRTAGRTRGRRGLVPAAVLLTAGLVTLSAGPALAAGGAGDPLGGLKDGVHKTVDTVHKVTSALPKSGQAPAASHPTTASRASTPSRSPGSPSSSSESGSNDVADPQPPDHAGSDTLHVQAGGQEVGDFSNNKSTVQDDDSTKSDATLLAIGGTEVLGAHADSGGQQHSTGMDLEQVTDPVCQQSQDAVCLDVLYASANATETSSRSHSDASSGIARFCIGGNGDTVNCQAPVQGDVGGSATQADRDRASGRTTASSWSDLAELCLSSPGDAPIPAPVPGTAAADRSCAVGASALSSQGQSDSGGDHPSASRKSSLVGFEAGGQEQQVSDPQALELPPGCHIPADPSMPDPASSSVLCAYANQGETYLGPGSLAGHAQEALKIRLLPGLVNGDLLTVIGARTETLVHNDGGEPRVLGRAPLTHHHHAATRAPVAAGVDASAPAAAQAGGLPNTGGPSAGLLAVGLLTFGAGAVLVAANRFARYGVAC